MQCLNIHRGQKVDGEWLIEIVYPLFLLHFGNEKVNPSWVHLFSKGLAEINTYCSFAFRKHWILKKSSSKSSNFFFKANAYCTFSTCNVLAFQDIKDEGFLNTYVTINVKFEGSICQRTTCS